ncbi:conserved hypothetical protein [Candidatus Desulfosporosinus infrequens]|uniref:Uncharacterized protein n=1 Tax=Candidatus Desulfosporosinus infrequens TaxID=2043169 RepID=A0A2U3K7Y5_9FIRM|nr:conserved hypothetical protein [Candidatus Desulfosporosinus infrequens]
MGTWSRTFFLVLITCKKKGGFGLQDYPSEGRISGVEWDEVGRANIVVGWTTCLWGSICIQLMEKVG